MTRWNSSIWIALIFLLSCAAVFGQDKENLQKERDKITEEISLTNKLLQDTRDNRNKVESQLSLLNRKITLREDLIRSLNGEISLYNRRIKQNREEVQTLETELQKLKESYAQMIRYAQHSSGAEDRLMYVFASEDFIQAIRRIKHLQQYARYRQIQAEEITSKRNELRKLNESLLAVINEKDALMEKEEQGKTALFTDLGDQKSAVASLQQEENSLIKKLKTQEKEREKLNKEIQRIIEEEIRASRKDNAGIFALTPEAAALSSSFEKNKGKLPWPVERGIITARFGQNPHPVLAGIMVPNNGIDIATNSNASVRVIFEGTVSAVFSISGAGQNVIVSHGGYRSVYSNLKEVTVRKGDKVVNKQSIGTVHTDDTSGKTESHLEIWRVDQSGTTTKQDPALWISGN